MTNTYTWTVQALDCYPTYEGETDVVFVVSWRCDGTDGTYSSFNTGQTQVPYISGDPYTPYADLTQSQVLGWVWANGVDQAAVEAALATDIENQVNPPVVTPPLPWSV